MLYDLAASRPIDQVVFSNPQDLDWRGQVRVRDMLRLEVEVTEIFPPDGRSPKHGLARVKVTLITTGVAGIGAWGDADGPLVDDVAFTYTALMQAGRRDRVRPLDGIS